MSSPGGVTLQQAVERLGLAVQVAGDKPDAPITGGIVGDLLSYVMAHGKQGNLWITIQTHPNIVAVAALGGLAGIVIAGGFQPEEDTVARAEDEGLALVTCEESSFLVAGRLYELGVR